MIQLRQPGLRERGQCRVCGSTRALYPDGMVYRHWSGPWDRNPDGTCKGWGKLPATRVTV